MKGAVENVADKVDGVKSPTMAKVSVSVDVPRSLEGRRGSTPPTCPGQEWLTIHRVFGVPSCSRTRQGPVVESIVEVMGMPNRTRADHRHFTPPETMTLNGIGVGGVKVKLIGKVRLGRAGAASVVTMDVHPAVPPCSGRSA